MHGKFEKGLKMSLIHPEYDEEVVLESSGGRTGGVSVRVRTCIAIAISLAFLCLWFS